MAGEKCGNCRHVEYDITQGYACSNDESEYVADFVEHDHWCSDWEGRGE